MKEEIKKFITNYGPILCALLCPIMSFLGTYYASKSAINEVYITEKYDISKIFFDKKSKNMKIFILSRCKRLIFQILPMTKFIYT